MQKYQFVTTVPKEHLCRARLVIYSQISQRFSEESIDYIEEALTNENYGFITLRVNIVAVEEKAEIEVVCKA